MSLATRTNPRSAKKPRLRSDVDEVRLSFEELDEALNGSKAFNGCEEFKPCSLEEPDVQKKNVELFLTPSRFEGLVNLEHDSTLGSSSIGKLWVDKYKPRSLEELAIQRKKVEEVRIWFEERLGDLKDKCSNNVLVVTGQSGVGKSETVRQIASHLGVRLYEWEAPTPTIWRESMHNSNTGVKYTSKLDEFEKFVKRIRLYGSTSPSIPGESKSPAILLIDDLPVTNGRVAFERLRQCLLQLVRATHIPTAIVLTDCGKADSGDSTAQSFEKLQSILLDAGTHKVAFNPITNGSIKKVILKICRQEHCSLNAEQIDLLAQASGGDIRQAITSLQFSLKQDFGRDETLSLFHALGKFLHNKRENDSIVKMDQDAFLVNEKLSRLPLKMDAPEKVLSQAHGQARPVADFLHENFLDFISEDAIDDAWAVASYLSDADLFLASFRQRLARHNEAENVLQSAAASVAARGVLFGNSHPVPPRWHAIRKPKLWLVEQSSLQNKWELLKKKFEGYDGSSSSKVSVLATEYAPALKWLGNRTSVDPEAHAMPIPDNKTKDDDSFEGMNLDDRESEISDYESEDD